MKTIGVDPGIGGALAKYDSVTGLLDVQDTPHWMEPVGKKKRRRLDPVGVYDYFVWAKLEGYELVMMEAVGARGQQTQAAGFGLGYTCGLIHMACVAARLPIETVTPQIWKRVMQMPGKVGRLTKAEKAGLKTEEALADAVKERTDANKVQIIKRAEDTFPDYREMFRGKLGGFKLDRAEASMLAKYAAVAQHTGVVNFDGE